MDRGSEFLAWIATHDIDGADWQPFVDDLPLSRLYLVAEVARAIAGRWTEFAEALEHRARR